ncbi:MAG: formate dehydrogenase accessory protein FdhE [Pseudomonadota bacterium]
MSNRHGEERRAIITALKISRPEYGPILDLHLALEVSAGMTRPPAALPTLDRPALEAALKAGTPLFSPARLPLDLAAAAGAMGAFEQVKVPRQVELGQAVKLINSEEGGFPGMAALFLAGRHSDMKALAEKAGVKAELVFYLIQLALKPSLRAVNRAVDQIIEERGWREGFCPLCGSEPAMARLEPAGQRTLHCGLCGREWRFSRMDCPFCRTADQERISYLFVEGEAGYRLYTCQGCGRYLKTLDARVRSDPAPLDLEDLTTMHLDILAQKKGFR